MRNFKKLLYFSIAATPSLPADIAGRLFAYSINISSQPNGIYLYRVIDAGGALVGEGKLVVEK